MGKPAELKLPEYSSAEDLATRFNDFFLSKINTLREGIISSQTPTHLEPAAEQFHGTRLNSFRPATIDEIKKLIAQIPNKTCQLDPIPTWLMKQCSDQLAPTILSIVNESLATAQVPVSLKKAVVRPLLKKADSDPETLKNYRPVSTLPTLEKLLEQVVAARLEEHLEAGNLHDSFQSAYRKNHSTETTLLKLHADITQALDEGVQVVLITLDLSAAFDTVDHQIMLDRLANLFGISGSAHQWMQSYFSDRAQAVAIDGATSNDQSLISGVPQGSVLGPKCYSMYTKPVGSLIAKHNLNHLTYADDTDMYLVIKPNVPWDVTSDALQGCLVNVQAWMSQNLLKLNMDKTEMIVFSPKHQVSSCPPRSIEVGDFTVKESACIRSLGVHLDKHLKMEKQVNATVRSCYLNVRNIGKIQKYVDEDACKTLVQSLVISRLDYANALYVGLSKDLLHRLQLVQNTAARIITRTSRKQHITPILYDLHWLPVEQRIKYKLMLHTFKALHGQAPRYIQDMLEFYTPSRVLRSASQHKLKVPRTRTVTYGKKSFTAVTAKLWNELLPSSLKSETELHSFKSSLKTVLFKEYYY